MLTQLRELGQLPRVLLLSTVLGGSIAGASWLCWHAKRGDTLAGDEASERYVSSLIWVMSMPLGARGPVFAPRSSPGVLGRTRE